MSTKNNQNTLLAQSIPSSENSLKVYQLTTEQYAKISRSLNYLANKAQNTNEWFAFQHFEKDGKVYVIFNLNEDAANHLITNGKKVPIQILGRLHKLGKRTPETPNQVKDRFTVSFLTTDKSKGREMSHIIAQDLQGSQIGEVTCSACGRKQKNRTQLWAVKKLENDHFDQSTKTNHQYSYLGSECVKQGFLGTDISIQQLVSIINRINEVESVLKDAPAQPTVQVYRSFDVQLNHLLKQSYQYFAGTIQQTFTPYNVNNELTSLKNYQPNIIGFPRDKHNLMLDNYAGVVLEKLSNDEYLDLTANVDTYAIYSYIHSNTSELKAYYDDKYSQFNNKLKVILDPYKPIRKNLLERYNHVKTEFNETVENYKLEIGNLNKNRNNFDISDEYPEQLYIQNALETIKANRELNNSTMRNAREIVMATQENKLFVPTLIAKMKSMINHALKNVNEILLKEFINSNTQDPKEKIQEINKEYEQKLEKINLEMQKIILTSNNAGQELYDKIHKVYNESIKIFRKENEQEIKDQEQKAKENPIKYRPFNTTWAGYTFSTNEIKHLRNGETITIPWLNRKRNVMQEVSGKLGFSEWQGREIFGFQPTKWGKIIHNYY